MEFTIPKSSYHLLNGKFIKIGSKDIYYIYLHNRISNIVIAFAYNSDGMSKICEKIENNCNSENILQNYINNNIEDIMSVSWFIHNINEYEIALRLGEERKSIENLERLNKKYAETLNFIDTIGKVMLEKFEADLELLKS